jgi:poly(3-hydroxybutyrate) depolymerase
MATDTHIPARVALVCAAMLAALVVLGPANSAVDSRAIGSSTPHTRNWTIHYRAHDGRLRAAYVLLPAWYGPKNDPVIPLVISPHGRGIDGSANARLWGDLPGVGGFAVVNPDGEGRRLGLFSWGYPGQIADLARMPRIVREQLPWLRIDPKRVYAVGGSMGGQETLLLVARHPHLLAGAVAVDSVTDLGRQYRNYPRLRCASVCQANWSGPVGRVLQGFARTEVGGTPDTARAAYADRSPLDLAPAIAQSCVPLQIWWSTADRVVVDPALQSGALAAEVERLNPHAPVARYVGFWIHTAALNANKRLPLMLAGFGLLPKGTATRSPLLHYTAPPAAGRCVEDRTH